MSVSEPSASVVIASDKETLDFYGREAEAYAARSDQRPAAESVSRLTKLLQPGARVLELGCGAGRDTAAMRRSGFDVTPIDGSPAMAAQAEERRRLLCAGLEHPWSRLLCQSPHGVEN